MSSFFPGEIEGAPLDSDQFVVKRSITTSLAVGLLLGVVVPVTAALAIAYSLSVDSTNHLYASTAAELKQHSFAKLTAVREIKKDQIEEYFRRAMLDTEVFARSKDVEELFGRLYEYDKTGEGKGPLAFAVETPEYRKIVEEYGRNVLRYVQDTGVYNAFLICAAHGHVMFAANDHNDRGANLRESPLRETGLAELWSKVTSTGKRAFVDFALYGPGGGEPTAFVGSPIQDAKGTVTGVVAIQLSMGQINRIMQQRAGFGTTGETYLVGPDQLMRSDSFLDARQHSVRASLSDPSKGSVSTDAVSAALAGKTGTAIVVDYNGERVLSAYTPIDVFGTRWALLAEIDEKEAFAPVVRSRNQRDAETRALTIWTILLWGVCIGTSVLLGLWVHRFIAKRIRKISKAAVAVANGNLNVHLDLPTRNRKCEIGVLTVAMQTMIDRLHNIADEITRAGSRMVAASREQAEGANNQSTATEQMASTAAELLASAQQMADSGTSVTQQAEQAANECSDGSASIENAISGINGIHERVEKIAQYMGELGGKSQQISGVLDIITELSEQTNLLSLNASIEAAGAGEAGKRFAVVASEIRKLAERATDSTGEIRALIDGVQQTVNATIMATEEGTKAAREGVRLTKEVDESFKRIAERVASTRQSAKAIEMGSRQQLTAISQMEGAVKDVDATAQETSATASQLDASARTLLESARQLQESHHHQAV